MMDTTLRQAYYDPSNPGGLGGIKKLYVSVKDSDGVPPKLSDIKNVESSFFSSAPPTTDQPIIFFKALCKSLFLALPKELLHNFGLPSVKRTSYPLNQAGAKLACGFANTILTWGMKI